MDSTKKNIKKYYDDLAPQYDQDRFGNSYGRYIDLQEKAVIEKHLPNTEKERPSMWPVAQGVLRNMRIMGLTLVPK